MTFTRRPVAATALLIASSMTADAQQTPTPKAGWVSSAGGITAHETDGHLRFPSHRDAEVRAPRALTP